MALDFCAAGGVGVERRARIEPLWGDKPWCD
jgi:hypothetical protein